MYLLKIILFIFFLTLAYLCFRSTKFIKNLCSKNVLLKRSNSAHFKAKKLKCLVYRKCITICFWKSCSTQRSISRLDQLRIKDRPLTFREGMGDMFCPIIFFQVLLLRLIFFPRFFWRVIIILSDFQICGTSLFAGNTASNFFLHLLHRKVARQETPANSFM